MKKLRTLWPVLLILLQDIIYGLGDPLSKNAYDAVPVFALLTARFWIGFVFLMLLFGRRTIRELRACRCKRALILPGLLIAVTYLLGNIAIQLTEATSVSFLRQMTTVFTPLMALVILRRGYSIKHLPVLAAVLAGLYLLCAKGGLSGFGWGEVLALLSAVTMSGALLASGEALQSIEPITVTTVQTGFSAVLGTLCALIFEGGVDLTAASGSVWLTIVYLGVLCTVGGYLMQNLALRTLTASTVSLLQCACPVMTALFSFILLDERLSVAGLVGAGIIVACLIAENFIKDTPNTAGE